jgi:apolipoprotein N-acyltransferase
MSADKPPISTAQALFWVLLSAGLFTLSFPPASIRVFAWIALVPWLLILPRVSVRAAIGLSSVWGLASGYGITDWLIPAVAVYYQQSMWVGVAILAVATVGGAVIDFVAFALLYRWAHRAGLAFLSLFAGAAWVVCDLGRARIATGNPWGLLGYTQVGALSESPIAFLGAGSTAILQVADIGGVFAVGFVLAVVNAVVALSIEALRGKRTFPRAEILVAVVVVVSAAVYGTVRLGEADDLSSEPTDIAIIQANLDLGAQWREELYGANLETYLRETNRVLEESHADLVFWPENAMTFFVAHEPLYRHAIAALLSDKDVELVAGAPHYEGEDGEETEYYNSAFLLRPDGSVAGRYDKQVLLPFAEYFPLPNFDLLRRSFGRVREFTPGPVTTPLETRAGSALVSICNEAMFGRVVRARMAPGASYLVNLTNDTWVPDMEFAEHQFNIATMRAVEQKRYLVRASTSGPSGIVDPYGRVLKRTDAFSDAVLTGAIRSRSDVTVYNRFGDLFAWICLAGVVAVVVIFRRRKVSLVS